MSLKNNETIDPIFCVSEVVKCEKDPLYFIENYLKLEVPGGVINFTPHCGQLEVLDTLVSENNIIINKTRQIGISSIIMAYILYLCIFNKNVQAGFVSSSDSESIDIIKKMKNMIEGLPEWLKPEFDISNAQSFRLKYSNSAVHSSNVNIMAPHTLFCGKAISILIINEAAFIPKISDAFDALLPSLLTAQEFAKKYDIPYGTIIMSTPNKTTKKGKWFYDQVVKATDPVEPGFKLINMHWKNIPKYADDPEWYADKCELLGHDKMSISQELNLNFHDDCDNIGGNNVFK